MHGNVFEWCKDSYNYYHRENSIDSETQSSSSENKEKVLRGGCWDNYSYMCRSANRISFNAYVWSYTQGFRIAIVPDSSIDKEAKKNNDKKQNSIKKEDDSNRNSNNKERIKIIEKIIHKRLK